MRQKKSENCLGGIFLVEDMAAQNSSSLLRSDVTNKPQGTSKNLEFITLQGRTHYQPFDILLCPSRDSSRLKGASRSYAVTQMLSPSSSYPTKASPCIVHLHCIHPDLIKGCDLALTNSGTYKHVQPSSDGLSYDVHYYNAGLRKSIYLGRFFNSNVASLAHWIARTSDDDNMRLLPFAAQSHIESLEEQSFQYLQNVGHLNSRDGEVDSDAFCDEILANLMAD